MASPGRKPFLLRMDPRLWSEIEAWAQAEMRSVNGQIEYLLRDAVRRRKNRPVGADEGPPASAPDEGHSPAP